MENIVQGHMSFRDMSIGRGTFITMIILSTLLFCLFLLFVCNVGVWYVVAFFITSCVAAYVAVIREDRYESS